MAKRREKQGCELRRVLLFAAKARVDSTDFHFSKKKKITWWQRDEWSLVGLRSIHLCAAADETEHLLRGLHQHCAAG
jgi:hypothetical protein